MVTAKEITGTSIGAEAVQRRDLDGLDLIPRSERTGRELPKSQAILEKRTGVVEGKQIVIEVVAEARTKIGIGIGRGTVDWKRSEAGTDVTEIVDVLSEGRGTGTMIEILCPQHNTALKGDVP